MLHQEIPITQELLEIFDKKLLVGSSKSLHIAIVRYFIRYL